MYFEKEARRGKGWGEKMIDICLNHAKENDFNICYIETISFMIAAQKLYLKKGFKHIYKPMGGIGHTNCDVWMKKHF